MKRIRYGLAAAMSAAALLGSGGTAFADGVTPNVDQAADPGEVINLTKTVATPPIPPKPDIVLLVDKTGSMGGELTNVKANFSSIVSQVQAVQPDAQFAVAAYCDFGDPAPAFELFTDLTGDPAALSTAINNVTLCNGGDTPEAQLNALWEIGDGGDAVAFRPDSSRIVVWYGDNPGHDPSGGHAEADATQSLVDVEATVLAISTG
ncbi:vWA domain-containing protein, partial [Nocardioides sp.]|uniref:vWA domain-containing protein n=1 Tax=Nocardioides sp. TaxID=35761 RepID=UPI00273527A5